MDPKNLVDLVAEKKQFCSYKVISRGKFAATIEVDQKDQQKKSSVLIMTEKDLEIKGFDFDKMQNSYTVQATQYEYLSKLQTYLIYTETGSCTLQDKVDDKIFRKSYGAIELLFLWIKQISLGLKQLHANSCVHLNISTKAIIITSDNRAKIGCFDFARNFSTAMESFETGGEFYYKPPECIDANTPATDAMQYDTWSVALLTIEAFTKNYIAEKSKLISSWPQQYAIMHKVLQARKFKKLVKKTYPKAAKVENLEKLLLLLKHTLKLSPDERPDIGSFYILLSELAWFNDIDKQLTEERMWKKNASLKDLENEMEYLALTKRTSPAVQSNKREIDNNAQMIGGIILDELDGRINESTASPSEHRDINQSDDVSSIIETSESFKVQPDPSEKDNAKYDLRLSTDQERGCSKQKEAFIEPSEIFVTDLHSDKLELPEKMDRENLGETGECLTKEKEAKKSSNIVIARNIFQKVINWTLDENLYTGVMQYGSYINQLSKALTG